MIIKITKIPDIAAFKNVNEIDQIVGLRLQASKSSWLSPLELTSKSAELEDTGKIYVRLDNLLMAAEEAIKEKPGLYHAIKRVIVSTGHFQRDYCVVLHTSEVMII